MKTAVEQLSRLAACGDIANLRSAVRDICGEFGKVTSIDVLTIANDTKRSALCFLRLESAAQELRLISALGACRFGNELLITVDLPLRHVTTGFSVPEAVNLSPHIG